MSEIGDRGTVPHPVVMSEVALEPQRALEEVRRGGNGLDLVVELLSAERRSLAPTGRSRAVRVPPRRRRTTIPASPANCAPTTGSVPRAAALLSTIQPLIATFRPTPTPPDHPEWRVSVKVFALRRAARCSCSSSACSAARRRASSIVARFVERPRARLARARSCSSISIVVRLIICTSYSKEAVHKYRVVSVCITDRKW